VGGALLDFKVGDMLETQMAEITELPEELIDWGHQRGVIVEREPISIAFVPYDDSATMRRQYKWLSFTSRALSEVPASEPLLDIGSNIAWLIGVASARQVEMVDIRPHPLRGVLPFKMHLASATALPFPGSSFGVVTFPQLLHWIGTGAYGDPPNFDGHAEALREISRVLKPGGVAIFSTFLVPDAPVFKLKGRRLFTMDNLRALCRDAGLEMEVTDIFDGESNPITESEIPMRSGRVLVPGNPDEDLAWVLATVRRPPAR
jgi:SAM-dependent methyltransferase